ncbi:MAG: hypothetical protein IPP69_01485 [Flavobacteriales bacterium]|jgi:hypothetical protein|nr:hypothetical protein [Flavobacteriales bacterium]
MNLQSILNPIADFFQWTFHHLLEPMAHWFNWVCIVFAFVAILYWLRRQRNYTRKAMSEGTTV